MFKINYFHLHLTDDQGWRIEIKKYTAEQRLQGYVLKRVERIVEKYGKKFIGWDEMKFFQVGYLLT